MRTYTATLQLWSARLVAFIKLGRFQFLIGGLILYSLGVAMAWYASAAIRWEVAIWGQVIVTATQLMVHYNNDYHDFEADLRNQTPTPWSGGSRVLQAGMLTRQTARNAAIVLAAIAILALLLLVLVEHPGPLAIPIVFTALVLSWQYSAPPLRLHTRGIGELSGVLVVSMLTPILGFYLQTGQITALPVLAVIPLGCLQFNMLLSVDIPDADGDAAANTRTLTVRLGRPAIARLYVVSLALAYLLLLVVTLIGLPAFVAICFSLNLPIALWLVWRVSKGDWSHAPTWGRFAFMSIALLMSAALLEVLGFAWLTISR